jgi:ABC-type uncharacterized transport system fused permease/ATPase subunit
MTIWNKIFTYIQVLVKKIDKKDRFGQKEKNQDIWHEKIVWVSYLTLILTRQSFNLNVDFRLIVKMWLIRFYPILLKKSSDLIWVEIWWVYYLKGVNWLSVHNTLYNYQFFILTWRPSFAL